MGALAKACRSPGKVRLPPFLAVLSLITCTVGTACSSVQVAVAWLFHSRQPIPTAAMTMAATSAIRPQRFKPGGMVWRSRSGAGWPVSTGPASGFLSGICLSRLDRGAGSGGPFFLVMCGSPAVNDAEDHGNEDQRGAGGEDQAADHGAAQRRILFAAIAQPQRHRAHADDHGQRRHADRTEAGEACF